MFQGLNQRMSHCFSPFFIFKTLPTHDYWGEFGAYGPCSRTCGTGVAMRTRKCITSRTDGGHNCLGSSKSFRTCNTQACPAGSKDFREEQCSQFNSVLFQGKHQTWVPYYGATNPCELNCVPSGQNFFYRHRPAVVDGTKCYVGRSDICVDGVCRVRPGVHTKYYAFTKSSFYCSAACNGGMQYRSVTCWVQDPSNPRVVDETHCISQHLQRPQSQQACNMHACPAEYSVSSFSVCSVTCGEGQQTREVFCVGSGGERLSDHACSGQVRPASVQTCRRPACHTHISWHCTRSCGGGVRERRVSCSDSNLNLYPEAQCASANRPISVEACNSQPCTQPQLVPSVQNPTATGNSVRGYVPHVNFRNDQYVHCTQSTYGCCPDGHTSATGPRNEGCSQTDCIRTRYGCCLDGVTVARGFGRLPSSTSSTSSHSPSFPGDVCSLSRDDGPCDTWKVRFYYDSGTRKCTQFWYGGCQGNANNFETLTACQAECGDVVRGRPAATPSRGTPRRVTPRRGRAARA
uniref:Papilin b, proteoglycan-like sulfated glycoprotein n=1 Tax=Salarias fasciatus TaxID=181472 RepID=A0A672H357_SALFA